ncbi:hypothetical protein KSP39_PZI017032 [Platanthera zijinensis]|uniref:Uncharacterized protein n=1 Tax=Platanthera zijinensis TaxID=2320716 RepID=A0AAP0B6W0_9ASPA
MPASLRTVFSLMPHPAREEALFSTAAELDAVTSGTLSPPPNPVTRSESSSSSTRYFASLWASPLLCLLHYTPMHW